MKVETFVQPAGGNQQSRRAGASCKRISFETNTHELQSNPEQQRLSEHRMQKMQRVLVDRSYEIQRQTVAPSAVQCQERFDEVGGWSDGIDFVNHNLATPSVASQFVLPDSKNQFPVTVVDHVQTKEMCQAFIKVTEEVGFARPLSLLGLLAQKAAGEAQDKDCETDADTLGDTLDQFRQYAYEAQKNTSEQVQIESPQLANFLWQRLEAHLPVETTCGGSFTMGRYEKRGLIPVFRFMRYQNGQGFKVHKDPERAFYEYPLKTACTGTTKYGDEGIFKSLFTFALYLNDDFRGGHLNFVKLKVNPEKQYESQATVVPVTGRCVIFCHDELHEGGGVEEGIKYMVQCDILYERVGDLL